MANIQPTTAIVRLGHVLYWAGCLIAALFIAAALFFFVGTQESPYLILIGRAAKYVLANE